MIKRVVFVVAGVANSQDASVSQLVSRRVADLREAGWAVTVGCVQSRTNPIGVLGSILQLRRLIKKVEPVVVHAQYGSMVGLVALLSKRANPLVVSFCGDDLLGTPNPGLLWRVRERIATFLSLVTIPFANSVIVKSKNLAAAVPSRWKKRVRIVPNGVPLQQFCPSGDLDQLRTQLGWEKRHIVLFNPGGAGNNHVKNPELASRAVRIAQATNPSIDLFELSDLSTEQVALRMAAASCLLVTSLHEGSPNIVKEAMACNLPVVSVDCGDVSERLANTSPGAVCDYSAEQLASAILAVVSAGTRSNGRSRIIDDGLSSQSVASRLCEVYEQLLGATKGFSTSGV